MKRLFFIKNYFEKLDDPAYHVVIIDEAGFGTKNQRLRNYGYALKGKEVLYTAGYISHNLTLVAAMSRERVEYLQLFYEGGTTSEYFAEYLNNLIDTVTNRYPEKRILFVLDNLSSHKTSEVHKVM